MHLGWERLRAAMRAAGVLGDLLDGSLHALLGPHARRRPTPAAVVDMLDAATRHEPAHTGFVCVRESDGLTARQVVARLRVALPELGPLTLVDERHDGRDRLVLRTFGRFVVVDEAALETERWAAAERTFERRHVTVRALVDAANGLLASIGSPVRLRPLAAPDGVEAYLAVDEEAAAILADVEIWEHRSSDIEREPPERDSAASRAAAFV